MKKQCFLFALLLLLKTASAQFTAIVSFNNQYAPKGAEPYGNVIRVGNVLYGMTYTGSSYYDAGNIFSVDTDGTNFTDLYDFSDGTGGGDPMGSFLLSVTGDTLFGMTKWAGSHGMGEIFCIQTNGLNFTDLVDFNGANFPQGMAPEGNLTFSVTKDTLYGMTAVGGANTEGNIFCVPVNNPSGFKDLFDFNGANGKYPNGSLTFSITKDTLFGMTSNGGAHGDGIIFCLPVYNVSGWADIFDFPGSTGANPNSSLTLSASGDSLFGMTANGGTNNDGVIFSFMPQGNAYTVLSNLGGAPANAKNPYGSLVLSGKILYGMSATGGISGSGNIFSISVTGTNYVDLLDFNVSNGDVPNADVLVSGSYLYGTVAGGGYNAGGVLYSYNRFYYPGIYTLTPTNASCNPGTGSAAVIMQGGISPYTYLWSPNAETTATATGLSAGTYTVVIHDNRGSSTSASVTITQPTAIRDSVSTASNILCNGGTGGVTIGVKGGVPPYTYVWSLIGQSTATVTGLSAGTYSLTLWDNNRCYNTTNVSITQPAPIGDSISAASNILCNGGTGSVTLGVSGGTSPYTYAWSLIGQSTAMATGLSAGTYSITIKDMNGCIDTANISITEPAAIRDSISAVTNPFCKGGTGTATLGVMGGTSPYTYLWYPGGQHTDTATGLSAGRYIITLTDNNGCSATTAHATITQPATSISINMNDIDISCFGTNTGGADAGVSGGVSPYSYLWAPGGGTGALLSNLTAGSYSLTITDANSCTITTVTIITQPTAISALHDSTADNGSSNGSATVNASGGIKPYTYSWMPGGQATNSITGLSAGTYTCTVTDSNGCKYITTIIVPSTAGINNITGNTVQINVYPNPFTNTTTVAIATGGTYYLEVDDLTGRKLRWIEFTGTQYQLSAQDLAKGIYFIRAFDSNKTPIGTSKIVVQ